MVRIMSMLKEEIPFRECATKGRKQTTGKFATREELEANLMRLYYEQNLSASSAARCCDVSSATANAIIKSLSAN